MTRCLVAAFALCLMLPYPTSASAGQTVGHEAAGQQEARQQPSASRPASEAAPAQASTAPASTAPASTAPASDSASLDRIRAGVERKAPIRGALASPQTPTFRTEVVQDTIKLKDYWSDRDPDKTPDPFMYPIPSAAELLIGAVVLKPKAALKARKQRAIRKQIQEELRQIEQQREETTPPPVPR